MLNLLLSKYLLPLVSREPLPMLLTLLLLASQLLLVAELLLSIPAEAESQHPAVDVIHVVAGCTVADVSTHALVTDVAGLPSLPAVAGLSVLSSPVLFSVYAVHKRTKYLK
jgi:hypothetical protein